MIRFVQNAILPALLVGMVLYSSVQDPSHDRRRLAKTSDGPAQIVEEEGIRLVQQPTRGTASPPYSPAQNNASQRMHYNVLQAFKEAIGNNWMATVRVLANGRQVAMGTVVDREGYAVTKASELPEGEIECRLYDGAKVAASVVSKRSDLDLALLKIEKSSLECIQWAENSELPVGSWLATTDSKTLPLSIGVVSVSSRSIQPERAVLGVSFEWTGDGNEVTMVLPGSGAQRAGLKEGDVIRKINDQILTSRQSMVDKIKELKAGQAIQVEFNREGETKNVVAKLMDLGNSLLDPTEMEVNGDISARSTGFSRVFQHDTILSPNQCGGPLIDLHGHAVGINIARAGRVCSYALPVSVVQSAVADMLTAAKDHGFASSRTSPDGIPVIRSQDTQLSTPLNQPR